MWRTIRGRIHRYEDKPAVIWPDGSADYVKNGVWHRDNGKPALVKADGKKYYVEYGLDLYSKDWSNQKEGK